MSNGKLTIKQEKFVQKYLECGNASEAYRFAYDCSRTSEKVIWVKASELLSDGRVSVRVKELQSALEKKSTLTKERILTELDAILNAKITDYVTLVTLKVSIPQTEEEQQKNAPVRYREVQRLVFKDFDQLTEKQIKAIESIKEGRNGIELKLHGKSWAIERICKMLGYDAPDKIDAKLLIERLRQSPLNNLSIDQLKKIRDAVGG